VASSGQKKQASKSKSSQPLLGVAHLQQQQHQHALFSSPLTPVNQNAPGASVGKKQSKKQQIANQYQAAAAVAAAGLMYQQNQMTSMQNGLMMGFSSPLIAAQQQQQHLDNIYNGE